MRIVVLGAGTVGYSIADVLCRESHSVTVLDHDPEQTRRVNELDVRVVTGSAAQSSSLFQAQALGADLCLAVTGSDEVNLIAASMAKAMGTRRAIARVYAPVFRDMSTFDYQRHFNIDRLLSLEHLSAMELARAIRNPHAVTVENFARGELEMQELVIAENAPGAGVPLKDLDLPSTVRIGSIFRAGKIHIAGAEDVIVPEDRITLIGSRDDVDKVRSKFQRSAPGQRRIIIAGGGETGYHLARVLEGRHNVVLMERDRDRSDYLSVHLKQSTVVNVDAKRRDTLEGERVGNADVFVACTGDDEDNIMACVEAKEIGAKRTMGIVNRPDYANVVSKLGIDHTVSPREVVAEEVLGYLNTGPVVSRTVLAESEGIEALEIDVEEGSVAITAPLSELKLPPQCLIGAVIRESFVMVPGAKSHFVPGDTVVALVHRDVEEDTVAVFTGQK